MRTLIKIFFRDNQQINKKIVDNSKIVEKVVGK